MGVRIPPPAPSVRLAPWTLIVDDPPPELPTLPGCERTARRLRMPATPFVARWLMQHAPRTLYVPKAVRDLAAAVEALPALHRQAARDVSPPPSPTSWWSHQAKGWKFLTTLYGAGFRGAGLFSGIGTGKTKVAIGVLDTLRARRVLVVGPLSAMRVWHSEIRKHARLPYEVVPPDPYATVAERLRRIRVRERQCDVGFVVALNYESVYREPLASWLVEQVWDLLIADEGHHLQDPRGKASLLMARLRDRARFRLALTGTPIPHHPEDVWALYRFLDPGVFPMSYLEFKKRYPVTASGIHNREELEDAMGQIAFRSEGLDLPPVVFQRRSLPLPPDVRTLYQRLEKELYVEWAGGTISRRNVLVKLLRLQQIACGFVKDDAGRIHRLHAAKDAMLAELLKDLREPVVVFAEYHEDLDHIAEVARKLRVRSGEYSGRQNDLVAFQAGDADLLAVQSQAGSEAVDMTRARVGVFWSLPWSLRVWDQAIGRLHRSGQTKPVLIVYLLVEDTIDARKPDLMERRADLVEAVLEDLAERHAREAAEEATEERTGESA